MFCRSFLIFSLVVFLTACAPATSIVLPTTVHLSDTAIPPALPLPEASISSPTPEMASPTFPQASPTLQQPGPDLGFTVTPLPLPTLQLLPALTTTVVPQPSADSGLIQFISPGPLSKVVSSVKVYGYAVPGHDNTAHLDLYGEDGRLLASQLLQLYTPYKWASFYWELPFHTNSVGELGRLTLSTQDDYGRLNAVNSIHLLLLSEGVSIITPPDNLKERCVIEQPVAGQHLSGGVLTVLGKMRPYNNLPLTLELVARDGSIIGTQMVPISPAPDGGYVPFRAEVPYNISQAVWALLSVRQFDDRIGGIMYLYSQELFLNP
ncbi:MAG: hypothetical protein WCE68_11515 [Anaerolineales bacterium]